jgi:hypothetical protein
LRERTSLQFDASRVRLPASSFSERPFLLFASVLAGVFKEIATKIEERGAAVY